MSHSLTCPHCHEVFEPTDSDWENISKQIRDVEFFDAVDSKVELERARAESARTEDKTEIARLKAELQQQKSLMDANVKSAANSARLDVEREFQLKLEEANRTISDLQTKLQLSESSTELALVKAESDYKNLISAKDNEIRLRDEEIRNMREMRSKLNVKLIGESLEQHCEMEFEKVRALAFKDATFGKDNTAVQGTKGDYVYRENMDDGTELLSIMFEMKNEADDSDNKKKNTDHLKKLDSDRTKKGCEYAILVSLLESDSELYNQGIVDVSHLYPKMYVIRPQFFIPMITLLRNAALNNMEAKQELTKQRLANLDVTKFEEQLAAFKDKFTMNFDHAEKKHMEAIDEIDKAIKMLQNVKAALTNSDKWLGHAQDKLDDLTVKKLVRGNPTMKAKFEEARLLKESNETG